MQGPRPYLYGFIILQKWDLKQKGLKDNFRWWKIRHLWFTIINKKHFTLFGRLPQWCEQKSMYLPFLTVKTITCNWLISFKMLPSSLSLYLSESLLPFCLVFSAEEEIVGKGVEDLESVPCSLSFSSFFSYSFLVVPVLQWNSFYYSHFLIKGPPQIYLATF